MIKKSNLFILIILFLLVVLIGAGCNQNSDTSKNIDWPEMCQGEVDIPEKFDKSLIFPGSKCVGYPNLFGENIIDLSFCAKAQKQEVLQWYKQELNNRGYEYWYDQEYAKDEYLWKKGQAYVIVGLPYTQEGEFLYFTLVFHP